MQCTCIHLYIHSLYLYKCRVNAFISWCSSLLQSAPQWLQRFHSNYDIYGMATASALWSRLPHRLRSMRDRPIHACEERWQHANISKARQTLRWQWWVPGAGRGQGSHDECRRIKDLQGFPYSIPNPTLRAETRKFHSIFFVFFFIIS